MRAPIVNTRGVAYRPVCDDDPSNRYGCDSYIRDDGALPKVQDGHGPCRYYHLPD